MSNEEIWFRANDGRELCTQTGSVAAKLMAVDPSFVRIEGPEGDELSEEYQGREPVMVDLSFMTEQEKIELAKTILGILE